MQDDYEDDSAILDGKLCYGGKKHYWIQDDEIGIKCKYCSIVKLEIRHVMPDFVSHNIITFVFVVLLV